MNVTDALATKDRMVGTKLDIGINEKDRKKIADGLSLVLADTYTLYLKTHNYHWNVTGPMFRSLHLMFEEQYNELAGAVDMIAERIRALGFLAPATYSEFIEMSSIKEERGAQTSDFMIRQLCSGHETVVRTLLQISPVAEELNDLPTLDLLSKRMYVHEKAAWMLRSILG